MSSDVLTFAVESEPLSRVAADVAVAGVFSDQRPLRGGAAVADWRMCGWLSRLVERGELHGELGESALVPSHDRLRAPRVLLLGLGTRDAYDDRAQREAFANAVGQLLRLAAETGVVDLPVPEHGAALETVAEAWVAAGCAALSRQGGRLLLRVVTDPADATALRAALSSAAAAQSATGVTVEVLRPGAVAPRPRRTGAADSPSASA